MYLTAISRSSGDTSRFVTTDDFERFKQDARKLKREQKIQHHEALDLVAKRARFANWHQVTKAHQAMQPTEHAIRHGIVIAMDTKDAFGLGDKIELKGNHGHFVSDQLLPEFYRKTFTEMAFNGIDEEDGRANKERWTKELLQECVDDWLYGEQLFYRFVGDQPPTDAQEVMALVAKTHFWGPQFVWIKGQMYKT